MAGLTLEAKMAYLDKVQVQAGYTFQQSRYDEPFEWNPEAPKVTKMLRSPDHYGYFIATYKPIKALSCILSGTYTGSMIVPHYAGYIQEDRMETTPDFFDLNFKASYTFVLHDHINLELNAGVHNILNSFQKDLDKGEFRDSGYFYGPTQPRTVFLGIKISR